MTAFDSGFESDLLQPRQAHPVALGIPPVDPKLAREAVRVYNEKGKGPPLTEDDVNDDVKPSLNAPTKERLPPFSATMRQVDVAREVGRLTEARKRIRLGPEAFVAEPGTIGRTASAKPSVCLFTVHDSRETCALRCLDNGALLSHAYRLCTSAISEDTTLLAGGFSESYIRLWDTRGPRLTAARSDFDPDKIKTRA